jgi:hypothetical protein
MAKVSVMLKSGRITRIAPRAASALVKARLVTMVAQAAPAELPAPPAPPEEAVVKPKRQYKRRDMVAEATPVLELADPPAAEREPEPSDEQSDA